MDLLPFKVCWVLFSACTQFALLFFLFVCLFFTQKACHSNPASRCCNFVMIKVMNLRNDNKVSSQANSTSSIKTDECTLYLHITTLFYTISVFESDFINSSATMSMINKTKSWAFCWTLIRDCCEMQHNCEWMLVTVHNKKRERKSGGRLGGGRGSNEYLNCFNGHLL